MFTITGNRHLAKVSVLFAPNTPASTPEYNPDKDATLSDIRARLKDIRDIKDSIVQARMMWSIRSSLEGVDKKNKKQTEALQSELDRALAWSEYTSDEKEKIGALKKSLDDGTAKASDDRNVALKSISVSTVSALPDTPPTVSRSGAIAVETGRRANFLRVDFDRALSHAILVNKTTEAEIYSRIVGEDPGERIDREKLFDKTAQSVAFLQELWSGSAGLYALLSGKSEKLMQSISEKVKNNKGKPLEIQASSLSGMSPMMQNIAGALVTTGVAVVTQGMGVVGHTAKTERAESYIDEIRKDTNPTLLSRLGKWLSWIGDALMGRKLSFTLGEERVADYKKSILTFADGVMKMDAGEFATKYPELQKTAKWAGIDINTPEGKEKIQKALIQSYIQWRGYVVEGSNWQMNIGLFFIGAGRDQILVSRQTTKESPANEVERELTKRVVSPEELTANNVSIERKDGKWIHIVPTKIQLAGDDKPLDVIIDKTQSDKGLYSVSRENVGDIRFSYMDGKYVVSFSDRVPQPTAGTEVVAQADVVSRSQTTAEVKNMREVKEKKQSAIGEKLYNVVGHPPKEYKDTFNSLIDAINSWDKWEIQKALDALKKRKFPTLAKMLEKDIENASTWTSYMYGTKETKSVDSPTQDAVNKIRNAKVLRAEQEIAKKTGIDTQVSEDLFTIEKGKQYTAKQASEIFPWQEMTLSVFASPLGGYHRVDKFDGSIAMSEKYYPIDEVGYKSEIVAAEKARVKSQYEKLVTWLWESKWTINLEKYSEYLKDGKIGRLGVPGLQIQEGKGTKIFEGRAMVAGNVCMNRMHGIVYPVFELQTPGVVTAPKKQWVPLVATMDASAALDITTIETQQSAIGVSVPGLISNIVPRHTKPDVTTTPGNTNVSTTTGNTTTNPGTGSNISATPGTGFKPPTTPVAPSTVPATPGSGYIPRNVESPTNNANNILSWVGAAISIADNVKDSLDK